MSRDTVLFPGAGSFGGELRPLTDALDPTGRVVRYPGRQGRDFGIPADSFDDVVRACAVQVTERGGASPVLFGHSLGAYVAYATAVRLRRTGVDVAALAVVGAAGPTVMSVPDVTVDSPAAAAAYLDGIDPSLLKDAPSDEWRQVIAETVLADLRLLDQFRMDPDATLPCPVYAARGDTDPLTTDESAAEWARVTDSTFSFKTFPGGHSDVLGAPACATWLRDICD